jgi:hypothetical protein
VADRAILIWKDPTSELLCHFVMDDCLCLVDDRSHFLHLETHLEALFDMTLQEGNMLPFLNLRIIKIPHGISIDQTDHIMENVLGPYFESRDVSKMTPIAYSCCSTDNLFPEF